MKHNIIRGMLSETFYFPGSTTSHHMAWLDTVSALYVHWPINITSLNIISEISPFIPHEAIHTAMMSLRYENMGTTGRREETTQRRHSFIHENEQTFLWIFICEN